MLVFGILPFLGTITSAFASQLPIKLSFEMSHFENAGTYHPEVVTIPSLADVLSSQRGSSIFYDYLRELSSVSRMVSNRNTKPVTLLVPTNKAVIGLPRKPCVAISRMIIRYPCSTPLITETNLLRRMHKMLKSLSKILITYLGLVLNDGSRLILFL
jgi:hypothetical protein